MSKMVVRLAMLVDERLRELYGLDVLLLDEMLRGMHGWVSGG